MSRAPIVLAGLVALVVVGLFATSGPVRRLEDRSLDTRFHVRGDHPISDFALVAIDEASLSELEEQWPLPRGMHARVIDRLREAGARQIVYDVQFTEPSGSPRQDQALVDAVARARGTVLATGETDALGRTRVLGGNDKLAGIGAEAAAGAILDEGGGIIRRYAPRVGRLGTIPGVVARRLGSPVPEDRFRDGDALIDFAGPPGTVTSHAFSDVLEGRVPDRALRGRIVIVGATAPTLQDLRPTSVSGGRLMSGPEIQANAIQTALDGNPLQELDGWVRYVLLVVIGGTAVLLVAALGPLRGAAGAAALGVVFAGVAQLAFNRGVVAPVAVPLLGVTAATAAAVLAAVAHEMAERRSVTNRNAELEAAVLERTAELERTYLEPVDRLARAAELRDGETGEHLERMSRLCERVALELGQSPAEAALLRQAATLHDVGKIGMPDGILRKPGKLTPEEIEIMRRHTTEGAALLEGSRSPLLRLAEVIARTHHERWDGTGYPAGLRGEDIPLAGRIAAACDVFDALITQRAYKRAWPRDEALAEIVAQRGHHFDPTVADALLTVLGAPANGAGPQVTAGGRRSSASMRSSS
jgi:CHASE2 domain-containing sensor protein